MPERSRPEPPCPTRRRGPLRGPLTPATQEAQPAKVRSELEIGRRLAFVLELIARGEVKAKMPKDAPLLDGLEVPERDLAGCEFATSQIASHCGSQPQAGAIQPVKVRPK